MPSTTDIAGFVFATLHENVREVRDRMTATIDGLGLRDAAGLAGRLARGYERAAIWATSKLEARIG